MDSQVLLNYIITPALRHIALIKPKADSLGARQFMVAVAAQESACGQYFKQHGNGPAQGIWQIEQPSCDDLYNTYLNSRPILRCHVDRMKPEVTMGHPLIACPIYSCAIARLIIYRQDDPMPDVNACGAMWDLYKKYYNSYLGKAQRHEWEANWDIHVSKLDLGESL